MPKARVHRRALCQDDILLEHGTLSDAFRRQRPARHLDLAGHSCSDCRRCENSVSDSRIYCTVLGEAHMARTQVCKFTQNPDTHTHITSPLPVHMRRASAFKHAACIGQPVPRPHHALQPICCSAIWHAYAVGRKALHSPTPDQRCDRTACGQAARTVV